MANLWNARAAAPLAAALIACTLPLRPACADADELPAAALPAVASVLGGGNAAYRAAAAGAGYRLANPAQAIDATVAPDRVSLRVGNRAAVAWQLRRYGRGDAPGAVAAARIAARGNRVELRHGDVSEWYVNSPLGLEQGFTLAAPPRGGAAADPVTLVLTLSGAARPQLDAGQRAIRFESRDGTPLLTYGGLAAYDAAGRPLAARLALAGDELRLQVDDRGARYPIVVDPLVQRAKLTTAGSATMAASVAISGDVIVASDSVAAAYVFVKPAAGWLSLTAATAKLTNSNNGASTAVAISGDVIVTGDNGGQNKVYVYVKPAGGWSNATETAILTQSTPGGQFGNAVAIAGDVVVAGAMAQTTGAGSGAGLAYVFVKPPGGWASTTETATLAPSDSLAFSHFGASVAIDGGTIVIGATAELPAFGGAAYVYVEPGGGWASGTQTAKLVPSNPVNNRSFGFAVGISGDVVVAGAPGPSTGGGTVYVFQRPGGGWVDATETAQLTASDAAAGDKLGVAVAIAGDTVIAGAVSSTTTKGAYVYERPAGGWVAATESEHLHGADAGSGSQFAVGVAIDGDTVVAGAPFVGNGAAYVFEPSTCGNGFVDGGEQCDDGNLLGGDGCSPTCAVEECHTCSGTQPSLCAPASSGTACSGDGNPCTDDQCNGAGACLHPANSATCDDSVFCNGADTCSGGDCALHAGDPCVGGPECDDVCNEATDTCAVAFGTSCGDDGNPCTLDRCNGAGLCAHPPGHAGTLCRASAGQCDVAESCDGIAAACPPDAFQPNGTGCDDGSVCTQVDACQSGACVGASPLDCDDHNLCTDDHCDPTGACQHTTPHPSDCRTALKSLLLFQATGDPSKDKLQWKWSKGESVTLAELSDPATTAPYALCVYDASTALIAAVNVPPSGLTWKALGSKGFSFKDTTGADDGAQRLILKSSDSDKAKALLKGKGAALPDPPLGALDLPLTVRLVNGETELCLQAVFDGADVIKNDATHFKAKH